MAKFYSESLAQTLNCTVCITDSDQIIAVAGAGKKDLQDKYISKELGEILQTRELLSGISDSKKFVQIVDGENLYREEIICPIISEGDVIGGVILLNKEEKRKFGEVEQKIAMSAAGFLGKQMEQ